MNLSLNILCCFDRRSQFFNNARQAKKPLFIHCKVLFLYIHCTCKGALNDQKFKKGATCI